jgi:Trk K+ transport system NAD-binding subunit
MIYGSDTLYGWMEPMLRIFERREPTASVELDDGTLEPEYVVIGVGRLGRTVLQELHERGDEVIGVDFDPRCVEGMDWGVPVIFGDAGDHNLPELLPLQRTSWVISTLRDLEANRMILKAFKDHGYQGRIAMSADDERAELELLEAGADVTIRPLHMAAGPLMQRLHEHG